MKIKFDLLDEYDLANSSSQDDSDVFENDRVDGGGGESHGGGVRRVRGRTRPRVGGRGIVGVIPSGEYSDTSRRGGNVSGTNRRGRDTSAVDISEVGGLGGGTSSVVDGDESDDSMASQLGGWRRDRTGLGGAPWGRGRGEVARKNVRGGSGSQISRRRIMRGGIRAVRSGRGDGGYIEEMDSQQDDEQLGISGGNERDDVMASQLGAHQGRGTAVARRSLRVHGSGSQRSRGRLLRGVIRGGVRIRRGVGSNIEEIDGQDNNNHDRARQGGLRILMGDPLIDGDEEEEEDPVINRTQAGFHFFILFISS